MPDVKAKGSQRKPDATTHHARYPERLHSHLAGAVAAAEGIAAPLPVEADSGTAEELVTRYGGSASPTEVQNE